MWKFVPPKPNADTPARRGCEDGRGHSSGAVGTKKGMFDQSTVGFGVSKFALGGMVLWCNAMTDFMIPAMPAAALR